MIKLRENEKVYLTTRRHLLTLFFEVFALKLFFVGLIVGMIFILFFSFSWPESLIEVIPGITEINVKIFLFFIISLILLIVWPFIFIIITDYYLDCWIVTNERTIHTELKGLFNRTISIVQHEKIQDISVDIHGFFPVMFSYGDVHMQTAGKFREFILKKVPNPYEIKSIIFKAQKDFKEKNRNDFIVRQEE